MLAAFFFGLVSVTFLQYIANVTQRTFEIVKKNRDPANIIGERSEPPLSVELSEFSLYLYIYKTEKHFLNEQRSKDAAAKKNPNTSGVGKINNYYEDIYIPPYNNTD